MARFAEDLAAKRVDAIVAYTTPLAQAALRATRDIPIVCLTVTDPVRAGLIARLRKPGGNVTGIAAELQELSRKLLQLVRETKPAISRVSVLYNITNDGKVAEFSELKSAAARLALTIDPIPFRSDVELDAVLRKLPSERPQAVVGLMDAVTAQHNKKIGAALLDARCPSFFDNAGVVEVGGLMSYAPKYEVDFARAGSLIAKILDGAKPSDLPVELPTTFELAVNMKTANALGLTIPPSLLLRADQIIE